MPSTTTSRRRRRARRDARDGTAHHHIRLGTLMVVVATLLFGALHYWKPMQNSRAVSQDSPADSPIPPVVSIALAPAPAENDDYWVVQASTLP
jgi:hypothetical protein